MNRLFINKDWTTLKKLLAINAASGGSLTEYTATGNPATFSTNVAKSLKQLLIPFTPVQSGSGDPSPENVRPISGVNALTVWHSGKNLFDFTQTPMEVDCFSVSGSLIKRNGFVIHLPSGVYTFSGEIHKSCYIYCNIVNADGTWVSTLQFMSSTVVSPSTVTLSGGQYIVVFDAQQDLNNFGNVDIMLTIGSTAATYTQYTGQSYPVTFPAEAGTVYGGSLELTTGVLTVDTGYIASYNGETLSGKWISDRDVYVAGTTPTTGAEVVYELSTPQTIQLDPITIQTLIGDNTVWTDTNGENTITYLKKG